MKKSFGEINLRRKHVRVVGGSVADIADFPYTVSLKLKGEHLCGGSLVSYLVTSHIF